MNGGVDIQYEALREKIKLIKEDISEVESILTNVADANGSLDEQKWNSPEKKHLDNDYIPYVEKIAKNIPNALRNHVILLEKTINIYENLEQNLTRKADTELVDDIL